MGLRTVVLAAVALLSSCAHLRVEVDVYKGPLANERRVQMEQLAAMAVAAKPLLVEVRDELEVSGWDEPKADALRRLRKEPWYRDYWTRDPNDEQAEADRLPLGADCYQYFRDPRARRVQSILGLFRDLQTDEYVDALRNAFAAYSRYLVSESELTDPDPSVARIADELATAEANFDAAAVAHGQALDRGEVLEPFVDPRPLLRSLRSFLRGENAAGTAGVYRDGVKLLNAALALDPELWNLLDLEPATVTALTSGQDGVVEGGLGANAAFEILSRPEIANRIVRSALGTQSLGVEAAHAAGRLSDIAASFGRSRAALSDLLTASLEYLAIADRDESVGANLRRELMAKAVGAVVEPTYLSIALARTDVAEEAATIRDALGSVYDLVVPGNRLSGDGVSPATRDALRWSLARALERGKSGTRLARVLLELHRAFAAGVGPVPSQAVAARFIDSPSSEFADKRRQYGLAVGPRQGAGPTEGAEKGGAEVQLTPLPDIELFDPADEASALATSDELQRGRLALGLDTLVDRYLDASYDPESDFYGRDSHFEALLEALVRFAEKLRVLGVLDGRVDDGFDQSVSGYLRILTAISNSLLSTANAVVREQDARSADDAEGDREWAAANRYQDTRDALDYSQSRSEVLGAVRATLRYQLIEELAANGEGTNADRLRLALAAARADQSEALRLLPASSYLRSSFITNTDDGSEGLSEEDIEDYRRIYAQFWQTVNVIDLRGGGKSEFVLIKDDVGNWYVKGFSASVTSLIKTARGLALYAAAGTVTPVALAQASNLLSGDPLPDGVETPMESGVLKLVEAEQERAALELATQVASMESLSQSLRADFVAAWGASPRANISQSTAGLGTVVDPLLETLAEANSGEDRAAAEFLRRIEALEDVLVGLRPAILGLPTADGPTTVSDRTLAAELAEQIVRSEIARRVAAREASLDEHLMRLDVLGG